MSTRDRNTGSISSEMQKEFSSGLKGMVITSESPEYDQARTIWNAMIDRRPGMIVKCRNTEDVIRAVQFARRNNLLVSIRGAGHNIAGNAICEGGLVLDLSQMNSVIVDKDARTARVGPGATLADVDRETQVYNLAVPTGINSTTGIAGLTLGGGFGWLTRKYGMTVDNLLSADVVTAEGKLVHTDKNENPDLFWGIRGGGGNFGVITSFEFQVHPVGPDIYAGLIVFPFENAKSLLHQYREFAKTLPDEASTWVVLRKAPPLPFLPESIHGKEVVVFANFYAGDPSEGEKMFAPILNFGTPAGHHLGVMPFAGWQQAFDPLLTPGARNYWKSHNFAELSDGAIETVIDSVQKLPSPHCEIFIAMLGGADARVPVDETAYSNRDTRFIMNVHSRWEAKGEDGPCIEWAREFFKNAAPYATGGVYVNFMTEEEGDRVQGGAYKSDIMTRLTQVKDTWDPSNFFCMNQNIKPSKT